MNAPSDEGVKQPKWPTLRDVLGPGLITGASDDDPSGIATYSQAGAPWLTVAKNLVLPHISLAGNYLTVVVAVFGTTISPYLFFWQAAEEVEDEKEDPTAGPLIREPKQAPVQMARMQVDTLVGMGFSNTIALFIMLTTAATLNAHGVTDIQTSSQAAEALRPIAGP
jgi:Mn2+/Fe2+ NRAMP family transporter